MPPRTQPYPTERRTLRQQLVECSKEVFRLNAILEPEVPVAYIDEVALWVESERELSMLTMLLDHDGWEKFNEATDVVRTGPIRSRYQIRYVFFRHPRTFWRLEVMLMEGGVSPLHSTIAPPRRPYLCTPVHASFKRGDEVGYAVARQGLERLGYIEAQRCDSTYGRFSYWMDPGDNVQRAIPYVKPRVNMRDGNVL